MKNTNTDPIDLHAEGSLPKAKKPSVKQPESSSASEETEKARVKILAGSSVGKLYRLFRERRDVQARKSLQCAVSCLPQPV